MQQCVVDRKIKNTRILGWIMNNSTTRKISHYPKTIALGLIRVYQVTLSVWIGRQCRFYPTCSHYTFEAISRFGTAKGVWLGIRRISKCHPFHSGGVDLVPVNDRLLVEQSVNSQLSDGINSSTSNSIHQR